MNFIDEIRQELIENDLLDKEEFFSIKNNIQSGVIQLTQQNPIIFGGQEIIDIPPIMSEKAKKFEPRYSVNSIEISPAMRATNTRVRMVKRNERFSRACKCCASNVFFLDAYCHNCNERMVGNFIFYSFFVVCGLMIGFMIFYMAISNPY